MELKTRAVYVAALLACSLIASSEAVTCYQCSSVSESGCSDPFKSGGIQTCNTGNVCTKAKGTAGGHTVVIRGCANVPSPKNDCAEVSSSEGKGVGCTCTSDRCNSAQFIIPSAWLLAVVGVLSMSAAIRN